MSGIRGSKKSIWDTRFGKQKKALAFDECLKVAGWAQDDWITMKGSHVLVGEAGEIIGGLGGKFKRLSDVPRKKQGTEKSGKIKLTASSFPAPFTKTPEEAASTQKLIDFINSREGVNPDVADLLSHAGDIMNSAPSVANLELKHAVANGAYAFSPSDKNCVLKIPEINDINTAYNCVTAIHEISHALDFSMADGREFSTEKNKELVNILKTPDLKMGEEVKNLFEQVEKDVRAAFVPLSKSQAEELKEVDRARRRKEITNEEAKEKRRDLAIKHRRERLEVRRNIEGPAMRCLMDVYDALSHGKYWDDCAVSSGHGSSYFQNTGMPEKETFAEFVTLSTVQPELVEVLRRDKPELVDALEKQVRIMNEERRKNEVAGYNR